MVRTSCGIGADIAGAMPVRRPVTRQRRGRAVELPLTRQGGACGALAETSKPRYYVTTQRRCFASRLRCGIMVTGTTAALR
jgi:hypothetical protein